MRERKKENKLTSIQAVKRARKQQTYEWFSQREDIINLFNRLIDACLFRVNLFKEKYVSDSLVMYMRFMTSGYLKMNSILYENYLEDGISIDRFCATEVDPIDKEAD